jgi:hypothetical protein
VEALGFELQPQFTVEARRADAAEIATALETTELGADRAAASSGRSRVVGVARVSSRSALNPGARASLAVDTKRLHFFTPVKDRAIRG